MRALPVTDLVVLGVGQLGQLYGAGALRAGLRVTPITREADPAPVFSSVPADTPVLLSVSEDNLAAAIAAVPASRHRDVLLVQNELFPARWRSLSLEQPTVLVVWLSKKKGRPIEVARTSTAFGPHAGLAVRLHEALELPARKLESEAELHEELVAKFAFILTINALGLEENLTLGAWLAKDRSRVLALVDEAQTLGEAHLGREVSRAYVGGAVLEAMAGLADYPARGRTAAARLVRALEDAKRYGLALPALESLGGPARPS